MIDREAFRSFLRAHYAPTTARKYHTDVCAYLDDPSVATREGLTQARRRDYVYAWQALEYYADRAGVGLGDIDPPPKPAKLRGGRKLRQSAKRKKINRALTRDEWVRIWRELDPTNAADVVLRLQMQTALRVGDILRVTNAALREGLADAAGTVRTAVKSGKEVLFPLRAGYADWTIAHNGMRAAGAADIAAWVSPGSDDSQNAAYHACLRRMKGVGERAGISEPHTTHRLRRSLSTFLREGGASSEQVRQVLDHEDLKTTNLYMAGAFTSIREQLLTAAHDNLIGHEDE